MIAQCPRGFSVEAESPFTIAVTNGKVLLSVSRSEGAGQDLLPTKRPCSRSPQIQGPGPVPCEAPCIVPRVSLVMLIASMVPSPASPKKFSALPYCNECTHARTCQLQPTGSFGPTFKTQVRQTTHIKATSCVVMLATGNHVKCLRLVTLCYTRCVVVPVCTVVLVCINP